jgi:hypothetical protein
MGMDFEGSHHRACANILIGGYLSISVWRLNGPTYQWQNKIPHSCGILGYFGLAHWFDSTHFALPKCTSVSMADK